MIFHELGRVYLAALFDQQRSILRDPGRASGSEVTGLIADQD